MCVINGFDSMPWTTVTSNIAITLENFFCGEIGAVFEERGVVKDCL